MADGLPAIQVSTLLFLFYIKGMYTKGERRLSLCKLDWRTVVCDIQWGRKRAHKWMEDVGMRKYAGPIGMFCLFEAIAVTLWLAKDNLFYLFNFTYIGGSLALGMLLYIRRWKYARHVVQFLVGGYMLVYLGVICRENMQIEGFWYYLFSGVFEAAVVHYAVLDGDGARSAAL